MWRILNLAFRFDEDEYEWVPCTDAHEINAPIEELPYVLSFYYGGTDEPIGSENGYVLCPYHRRLEEVEQHLSHGIRSVCGCEICGLSNHGTFDMSQGRPKPLYIPFRWRLFQRTSDGPLNVAADVAEVRYETKGVSLQWHNFALSVWAVRRRWECTRIRVDGKLQPWTACTAVYVPPVITELALDALARGIERSCGIRPSSLSRMYGASMITAYIERPFDPHIVYLKKFLAHAVEDFDETFPYEETNPYRILCECLEIHPSKSVRRAYTYTPYAITWYLLLRQMGMREVALMQPFLELEPECDIGEQRISEFYFEPKTRRVELCNSGNRLLWAALEEHAAWLCRQKGEKALADFLWENYVWKRMTQCRKDILLNFRRYGAQLTPEVKRLLLREGLTQYVRDAIAWEVEAITSEDEPRRILYKPETLCYQCCVNDYDFRLVHHTDELAPLGIALHNCLASYRSYVIEKSSIIVAVCKGERYVACIELDRRCHIVQALVLGLLYQRGRLMRCDVQRALYWLSWAADHGDGEAALAAERLQHAISSGSMERDLAILRGIQELRRRFPMKGGAA